MRKIEKIWIIITCIFLLIIFYINCHTPPEEYTTEIYTVQAGDTAWKIAKQFNSGNKDIREIIYYIGIDNNIKAGYIYAGQELIIRIYGDDINE